MQAATAIVPVFQSYLGIAEVPADTPTGGQVAWQILLQSFRGSSFLTSGLEPKAKDFATEWLDVSVSPVSEGGKGALSSVHCPL